MSEENIVEQDRLADEYLASIEARKYMRRLSKSDKENIAASVARSWIRWAADKIAEGQNPAKLSDCVRNYVLATIDDRQWFRDMNYYIPSSTVTRICNMALSEALSMLGPQTKYPSVRSHFQTPKQTNNNKE